MGIYTQYNCSYYYKLEGPGKHLTKNDGWIVMSYLLRNCMTAPGNDPS